MRWTEALRRDVVSTVSAETIGQLDGIVVDADASPDLGPRGRREGSSSGEAPAVSARTP